MPMHKRSRIGRNLKVPTTCPSGKRAYVTRTRAIQAGRKAQQARGEAFDWYKCDAVHTRLGVLPGCGQYHLTTRRKERIDG